MDVAANAVSEKQFAVDLKVMFTPNSLFFNDREKRYCRVNGYYPPHQLLATCQYAAEKQEETMTFREAIAASGVYKLQPSIQRFISRRADRLREQEIQVDP